MINGYIEECEQFLKDSNINAFKVSEWKRLITDEDIDPVEYDKLILYFAVNVEKDNMIYAFKGEYPEFLNAIYDTIYEKIKDKKFRGQIDIFSQIGVVLIAEQLTTIVSPDNSVLSVFISFVLLEVSKMGIDAWCKYYEWKKKQ